ncbi:MAG: helix-turn-helix domain-containing protein [Candidatus Neomarinimicrobiota bacterium]
MMTKLLTAREVAAYLRLSYLTILDKIRLGEIPASRIGGQYLVSEADLHRVIEKHKVKPLPS